MNDVRRGLKKFSKIPIKIDHAQPGLSKPSWIQVACEDLPKIHEIKSLMRVQNLVTVCEEASCPNLYECFSRGVATFMIMGDVCTRRCSFCNVSHGRPSPLDSDEPIHLLTAVQKMKLRYVVITSVNRDDLLDGGAAHFSACVHVLRSYDRTLKIEILVPDFRGKQKRALENLVDLPDVFNHNIETVPSLYPAVRPGSDYQTSLDLLLTFKKKYPHIFTKSGIMLGLGETEEELLRAFKDLRTHQVDMLTLGQYLSPSSFHFPVKSYTSE